MDYIADILLVAGALGAAFYCFILARRLARFNDLESGVGGAVAVMSAQVDEMSKALKSARSTAEASRASLYELTERAEGVAKRLELLVAAMHDLPEPGARRPAPPRAEAFDEPPETPRVPVAAATPGEPVFARRRN